MASSNFLLPNATVFPELLAFLVVLFLLSRYVLPPLNAQMRKRQQNIADSLKVIDEAKTMQAEAENRARTVLEEARQQARTVLDNANRLAEQVGGEARRSAEEEYARIVARAQAEIERSRQQAEAQLLARMADLVVATAEQVVEAEIDASRHTALIDEAIAAAGAANPSGAAAAGAANPSGAPGAPPDS
jgi:F-type H+-transporting ATPase subunit b